MGWQIEPSADARVSARALHDYYTALVGEGFTEEQAMEIIKTLMLRGITS